MWVSLLLLGYAHPALASAWPPAYQPDPYSPSAPLGSSDPLADDDDSFPGDVPDPLDPLAPPLSLDSARSEYRRMIDDICGLFPQAAGVLPSAPPPRALFESFFAPAAPATPSLQLNWFDRVRTSLVEADSRVASILSSGRPERLVLPQRLASYAVKGDCALGRAVPVNELLLSHFERPLRPTLQLGVTVRDAMALEASCRAQSEALSHSMWVLSGLLGFVRLQDFIPADPALFHPLVTSLSKSLVHQAQVTASHINFLCHRCREFYLSHLPAYCSDVSKRSMLSSPAVFADSLFREVRRMSLVSSKRLGLPRPSSHNRLWSTWHLVVLPRLRSFASGVVALPAPLAARPLSAAASLLPLPRTLLSGFSSIPPLPLPL